MLNIGMEEIKMINNFNWAISMLKQRKKVRRPCWQEDSYWVLGEDEKIVWCNKKDARIHLNQINATDWEVFEEKLKMKVAKEIAKKFGASHVRITTMDKKGNVLKVLDEYKEKEDKR